MTEQLRGQRFSPGDLAEAWAAGGAIARAAGTTATAYALAFTLPGAILLGGLIWLGWLPLLPVAAGGFMLLAPVGLAGFFGIAEACEAGRRPGWGDLRRGFATAAPALWALALVCGLLFMIFVTDAAILYAYLVGGDALPISALTAGNVTGFVAWAMLSGGFVAFLLYCISAFAVPLLCERRCSLVAAVVSSVRLVFGNFLAAMSWGAWLAVCGMLSVLLLPSLPWVLPRLAFASRALYRRVLPQSGEGSGKPV